MRSAKRVWLPHPPPLAPAFLLAVVTAAAPAAAQDTIVSAGLNVRFVSGSFGSDQTTQLVYVPAVLRVDARRFEVAGYFPYLTIDDGTVAPSHGGFVPMRGTVRSAPTVGMSMPSGSSMGRRQAATQPGIGVAPSSSASLARQSGVGDVVASVGYRIVDRPVSGVQIVVSGRFKVPTATWSRGLGTGRADAGTVATFRKQSDRGWLFGELGYLFIGDPAGTDLKNAVLWGVGAARRLTDRLFLLASASGNGAIVPGFAAPAEVGMGVGLRIGGRTSLTVVPSIGLTDASPDYGLTLGLSTNLIRR